MKTKLPIIITTLVAVLLLMACTQEVLDKPKKKKKPVHLVEIATAVRTDLGVSVTRTGTLKYHREVKIYTQEAGRIKELPFYEGDKVKEGVLVARLDDKLLQAQLQRAEATLNKSRQDLKRLRDLSKRKLASDQSIADAETELAVASADKELLETRLSYTRIAAPISGIVTQRFTEPGNVAERYNHLLTIADHTSLITEVTVSELLLPELKVGNPVQVRIDALGANQYKGSIARIHPNLDPVTRRGIIEVELKPAPKGALSGQFCRITLNTHAGNRLVIPFRALRRDTEGEYVFVANNESKAERVAVISSLRIGEQIEIISGLKEGQRVITKGFLSLKAGKKIKPVGMPVKQIGNQKDGKASATRPD